MKLIPLGNYLTVDPLEERESGKLKIPETIAIPYQKGYVIAISDDITAKVAVGDLVMFHKNDGHMIDGQKLIRASDLLAIITV